MSETIIENKKQLETEPMVWTLVCDHCNKREYPKGTHAAALRDSQQAGWLITIENSPA